MDFIRERFLEQFHRDEAPEQRKQELSKWNFRIERGGRDER